jgi:glyoxylase-like metal-dependent hydrolase (beta-lactamase superfamily II)
MARDRYPELLAKYRDADPDVARFVWTGGPVEAADGVWFQSMMSGCTAFATSEGLVLVDTGTHAFAPALAEMLRQKTDLPVHTAIYTHGHVDHAYGLDRFLLAGQRPPRVVGHRAMLPRFARYERTKGHNRALNARQFGGTVNAATPGGPFDIFHNPPIFPDTLYDERLTLTVGGLSFELQHCRGETDDHTWVWCAEKKVLCPGDLFIWAVPNAGNPQKVQRYPWDWARGLRQMAALHPASLCPGHGGPVVRNPEKIQRMLLETAEFLESIVSQTLDALEDGSPPHVDIVHQVKLPQSDSPWLQPLYDDPEFLVRSVIRYYGGWWTGRPSELKPAPRAAVAREIATLAGGANAVAKRALAILEAGDARLACHLADYALEAAPNDPEVQTVVADVYNRRADSEPSLMATNLFRSAASYAKNARPFA